jgi:hypothetical protein
MSPRTLPALLVLGLAVVASRPASGQATPTRTGTPTKTATPTRTITPPPKPTHFKPGPPTTPRRTPATPAPKPTHFKPGPATTPPRTP